MARPRKTLTAEQAKELEVLAAVLNQEQIADYFEISQDTFQRIVERDAKVLRSYKKGKSKAIASIGANLIGQAKSGNTAAAIFYLKTQAGWSENKDKLDGLVINNIMPVPTVDNVDDWEKVAQAQQDKMLGSNG